MPTLPKELLPENYEQLKEMDSEVVAYIDNMNRPPENFPKGSEGYKQFSYTGRKKQDKETLKNAQKSK